MHILPLVSAPRGTLLTMPPQNPDPHIESSPSLFERLSAHPYFTMVSVLTLLISLGLLVVVPRLGITSSSSRTTWTSAGSIFLSGKGSAPPANGLNPLDIIRGHSLDTNLPTIPLPQTPGVQESNDAYTGSLDELLALLSATTSTKTAQGAETTALNGGFSFIPQGLLSVDSNLQERTPLQSELYSYGNDIGTFIQAFESLHTNIAQIQKDHMEDRTNSQKIGGLRRLGEDYAQLGSELAAIQSIPSSAQSAHTAYANSYIEVGANLEKIATTKSDEEFLKALEVYNASVESLSRRFFILTTVFSTNGVKFSSTEPGGVFMFTTKLEL